MEKDAWVEFYNRVLIAPFVVWKPASSPLKWENGTIFLVLIAPFVVWKLNFFTEVHNFRCSSLNRTICGMETFFNDHLFNNVFNTVLIAPFVVWKHIPPSSYT